MTNPYLTGEHYRKYRARDGRGPKPTPGREARATAIRSASRASGAPARGIEESRTEPPSTRYVSDDPVARSWPPIALEVGGPCVTPTLRAPGKSKNLRWPRQGSFRVGGKALGTPTPEPAKSRNWSRQPTGPLHWARRQRMTQAKWIFAVKPPDILRAVGTAGRAGRPLQFVLMLAFALALPGATTPASAQLEVQYQYGRILNPFSAASARTHIFTLMHAGSWRAGTSFFFLDYMSDGTEDGFNDRDLYGEWYPTLSLGSLSESGVGMGPVHDIRLVAGVNIGIQPKVVKYVPGVELGWKVPGFIFVNTLFGAFVDASSGHEAGGAPSTGNGFHFDVSWLSTFRLAGQALSFAGHAEYTSELTNERGGVNRANVLAQPQLYWDVGRLLTRGAGVLHLGVEYQLWINKLGTPVRENMLQLLIVWRMD